MEDQQKPMPLDQLSDHINSLKAKGEIANCVVDMGMIIPEEKTSWSKLTILSCLIIAFSITIGIYHLASPQESIIALNSTNNIQSVEKIVQEIDNTAKIVGFNKKSDGIYEVKISTKKNKQAFIKSFDKKSAELKQKSQN